MLVTDKEMSTLVDELQLLESPETHYGFTPHSWCPSVLYCTDSLG